MPGELGLRGRRGARSGAALVAGALVAVAAGCGSAGDGADRLGVARAAVCTTSGLSASPASPQMAGATVTFTATSTCGSGAPEHRFWVQSPSGSWYLSQGFSPQATFAWDTQGLAAGTYTIEVNTHAKGDVGYDIRQLTYTLTAGVPTSCQSVSLGVAPASPQPVGTVVTATAAAGCASPEYRFWVHAPSGTWTAVQDWSTSATFAWDTGALAAGAYELEVNARHHGAQGYESYARVAYVLTGGSGPCTAVSVTASPKSPQPAGATVTFTATATCGGSATAEYRFWIRDAATGAWSIVQDFCGTATYDWCTAGLAPGTYGVEVDVRRAGESGYTAFVQDTFVVQ